jgi:hypothetical protein
MDVDSELEPSTPTGDRGSQKEILRGILQKFIDTQQSSDGAPSDSVSVNYKGMVELLHPVAMEYRKRVGLSEDPKENASPAVSMIISLDDELEWQESSRTHSPRTPSAPEALRNLKRGTPQTPPRTSIQPDFVEESRDTGSLAGITALKLLAKEGVVRSSTIRGDHLYLPDGTILPLSLTLPLRVRIVIRKEDGGSSESSISEDRTPLSVGSAWLSMLAERTYESSLASLLRARRGLQEIYIEDRIVLNRYLRNDISLRALQSSKLWVGPLDEVFEDGQFDGASEPADVLSEKLRLQNQKIALEEKKKLLRDQQLRLRRLLARELQRMHSSKPAVPAATIIRTASADEVVPVDPNPPAKRNMDLFSEPNLNSASQGTEQTRPRVTCVRDTSVLYQKLKELEIEWYRVGDQIRRSIEDEGAFQRRIKRLRYV